MIEGIVLSISSISVSGTTSVEHLQLLGQSGFPHLFSQSGSSSTSFANVVSSGAVVESESHPHSSGHGLEQSHSAFSTFSEIFVTTRGSVTIIGTAVVKTC